MTNKKIFLIITFIYLFVGAITLPSYGISWDEPTHFKRGNAYLWYFLTGDSNYDKLPEYDLDRAKNDPSYHERSFWQIDSFDLEYQLQEDGDHPVLNDILAAFTNFVFYQKLGWVGDIEGYHLFEVFISAILVGTVYLFGAKTFGKWTGLFAVVFMATYPLFWSESHFNIKDPAETAFFTLTLFFFWRAFDTKKARYLIISAVFSGLSLATKFNIVFAPFIIAPWLISLVILLKKEFIKSYFNKRFVFAAVLFPVITLLIFEAHWPWLWQDFVANTIDVIGYYRYIGLEDNYGDKFYVSDFNLYASRWILFTTQPLMLVFFVIGAIASWKFWKKKSAVLVLWGFWFLVPILRVTWPGTSIYNGVRQIMEYVPAMALIAGFGVTRSLAWLGKSRKLGGLNKYKKPVALVGILVMLLIPNIKLHPNENVYVNILSGGLKRLHENQFPDAGFSFGNSYWQGIQWINENAEDGAKLALLQGTNLNVPPFTLREGVEFSNYFWTGIERGGEYLMEVVYTGQLKTYNYAWEYVEKTLDPVYEVKVDAVSILTIWKNDLEHTKDEYKTEVVNFSKRLKVEQSGKSILISLPETVTLSRLSISYDDSDCEPNNSVFVDLSVDGGVNWIREMDEVASTQMSQRFGREDNEFWYHFAAKPANAISIEAGSPESCILHEPSISLKIFE